MQSTIIKITTYTNGITIQSETNGTIESAEILPIAHLRLSVLYPKGGSNIVAQRYTYIDLKSYGVTIMTISDNPDYERVQVNGSIKMSEIYTTLSQLVLGE